MKIKVKKKMNLHELIQWAWENDVRNKTFRSDKVLGQIVRFDENGYLDISNKITAKNETFTVEIEETITEEYKLPEGLAMYKSDNDDLQNIQLKNLSINDAKKYVDELDGKLEAFYMVNSSTDLVLIWKDGRWWNE
ncbi:hypothetical protein [Staphylococcus delphini]|uniref:Phage PVL protein n=1 Tax=Staphylococcus delphini TaxID=53344 RepID=A0AAX0QSM2_9STAP|nr:hypothetical protein [Staphylococcus delphini]PCF50120.1 hypothetical protein B5C07_07900 [Staphylococcus delphini]PNZ95741.1 hypothetical protein CD148_03440 [Staphylococcus delphini]RIZ56248.1 hypothetical protein CDL68_01525 [Staphylococcus delphini]VED62475.1 putative phage PVL protein [Staphylococcus delphini]